MTETHCTTAHPAIPKLPADVDATTAALAYAKAGLYVLPVKRGGKHPGSVVGNRWQDKSTRDPKVIAALWPGTDRGIALDLGRSGLVVIDVDRPELLESWLETTLNGSRAPYQSTRPDTAGRGHYVFSQPPGRRIGCGKGGLAGMGLDVKGCGGVIIVEPTQHPEDGGAYRWITPIGPVPVLPDSIDDKLGEAGKANASAATDAAVSTFLTEHIEASRPALANVWPRRFADALARNDSRHEAMVSNLVAAVENAKGGYYPARPAVDTLRTAFIAAKTRIYNGQPPKLDETQARDEFAGILAWSIGQAASQTRAEIRARVERNLKADECKLLTAPADAGDRVDADTDYEPSLFETEVGARMDRLRVEREAKRRLDDAERPALGLPPIKSLDALLAEPDAPTPYLIDDVAPAGARTMLSAPQKAGKTSLTGNLIRSLVDGDPFLGKFVIREQKRRIVLIDNELAERTLCRWLREQNITNTAAVADVISLRGRVSTFNIIDDRCRAEWAQRLSDAGCDYLAFDCLRPILDALGLDENRDAGRFLVAFDALLAEAGIPDALMVHHMGHGQERARGDSRLQDWPDAIWQLVRAEPDNPHAARFFRAHGRDVDVREGRLDYDQATRRLTYAGGTRGDAKTEAALDTVIDILAEDARKDDGAGLSGRTLEDAVEGEHPRAAVRQAIQAAIGRNLVERAPGPKRAKLHRIVNPCDICGKPIVGGQGTQHFECQTDARGRAS